MGDPAKKEKKKMTTGRAIALGIAITVGALGLFVVGSFVLLAIAMSSYGSNK